MNRTERRRQSREDRARIGRGLNANRTDPGALEALMRVLHELIEDARDAGTVAPLMQFLHANAAAAERLAPRAQLACRRGCTFCCHAYVSARAPELLFLLNAIPGRHRAPARAAVEQAYAETGTLGPEARGATALACPMLQEGACRVYAARPMTCRMAVSQSADSCARAFAPGAGPLPIPVPDQYPSLRRGYSLALAGALRRAGFASCSYELNAGLRAALARADAEGAWLAGEDVFAEVPRDPGSDPVALPSNLRIYEAAFAGW